MKKKKSPEPEPIKVFFTAEDEINHRIELLEDIQSVHAYEDHTDNAILGMITAYKKSIELINKHKLFK